MAKFISIILFNLISLSLLAQDLKAVDEYVVQRFLKVKDIDVLATKINQKYTDPLSKSRAIYCFIANTIAYDVDAWKNPQRGYKFTYKTEAEKLEKLEKIRIEKAEKAIRSRKAVCDGYSTLFEILCEKTGVECYTVNGTSKAFVSDLPKKTVDKIPNDHAWNIITIKGEKYLVDATWGAGSVDFNQQFVKNYTDTYFMMPPKDFILNHYPSSEGDKLINVNKKTFYDYPLFYLDYFLSHVELVQPLNKEVKSKKAFQMVFTDVNNQNDLLFAYDDSKYALEVKFSKRGNKLIAEVPASTAKSKYFNVYFKNSSIVTFLVK
ncbi:hypothetical protein KMW28_27910 [Flammeovirga yaeyamensis]|uniref:Transglutaminase-like domain-containing protein n=1 Tax=Flammeovirga yaeyamensis TaxID=367791 RepID=A0AAX1NEN0_9BACT|nr:transglutaminase domain-containing protein [Flammeovirga yaeyamensis]MBB3699888.1 transglutaminase/protease-like cytokinesis protein 3 [Flammeovirga yaeyamensis]NMF38316.1 hypothetical protein [Flammeovirga yaeyamensis]QWG04728.1 hypothetical protein KMW28_27910 [Flammeovirga yaeyamensis]